MKRAVILSLPQGIGKSLVAHQLASQLGLRWVADPWSWLMPLVDGGLHLTSMPALESQRFTSQKECS